MNILYENRFIDSECGLLQIKLVVFINFIVTKKKEHYHKSTTEMMRKRLEEQGQGRRSGEGRGRPVSEDARWMNGRDEMGRWAGREEASTRTLLKLDELLFEPFM